MRIRTFLMVLMGVALLVASPAFAEKGDSKFRFGAQLVSPTGDYTETGSLDTTKQTETLTIEADSATGVFVEYEYMVTDKAGIFGGLSFQSHDVTATVTGLPEVTIGDTDLMPLEFGVNFYVAQNDSVAFFLGPKVAYVMIDDVSVVGGGTIPIDNDFGFGANFGVDVPLGESNWVFSAGLQYLIVGADTDEGIDDITIDIDPIVVKVGAGVRF